MLLYEKYTEWYDKKDVYEEFYQSWLQKYSLPANLLIEQHVELVYTYLMKRKTATFSDRIKMLLCGESPSDRRSEYIFSVMDEFKEVMDLARDLIYSKDIMRKNGGTTYVKWEHNNVPRYMHRLCDSETNSLAVRIINTAVHLWCQLRPGYGIESFYVSTTVYETHKGRKPGDIMIFMVDMIDERFVPVVFRRFHDIHGQVMNPSTEAREGHTREAVVHSITPLYKQPEMPKNMLQDIPKFEKLIKTRARSRWANVPVIGRMCSRTLSPEEEERLRRWCWSI